MYEKLWNIRESIGTVLDDGRILALLQPNRRGQREPNHDSRVLFIPGSFGETNRVAEIVEALERERGVLNLALTEIVCEIDRPGFERFVRRRLVSMIGEKCSSQSSRRDTPVVHG